MDNHIIVVVVFLYS